MKSATSPIVGIRLGFKARWNRWYWLPRFYADYGNFYWLCFGLSWTWERSLDDSK